MKVGVAIKLSRKFGKSVTGARKFKIKASSLEKIKKLKKAMKGKVKPKKIKKPPKIRKPIQPNQKNWIKKGGTVRMNRDRSVTYTNKHGVSVTYRNGYPDFRPHAHPTVKPVKIKVAKPKNRNADFRAANKKAGLSKTSKPPITSPSKPPKGYTWHHCEDGETMILVKSGVHKGFPHTGGVSVVNS